MPASQMPAPQFVASPILFENMGAALMDEKDSYALIPRQSGAVAKMGTGPKLILDRMVTDALAVVQSQERALAAAHFRIGDYGFCDPDYRQILIWAEELQLEPVEILKRLLCTEISVGHFGKTTWKLAVIDGHIVTLVWDFNVLPISVFKWVNGLSIQSLAFKSAATANISLQLPTLKELHCCCISLTQLDLSNVPNLFELWCSHNIDCTQLNLSSVPNLTTLICGHNNIDSLDLSNVPNLAELWCLRNPIKKLDLSNVPNLKRLWCEHNNLTELNLSNVPNLTELNCRLNQISELDLSAVPNLVELDCESNLLTELYFWKLSKLERLNCSQNRFSELDFSDVLRLKQLNCAHCGLEALDLSKLPCLTELLCEQNQLTELNFSYVSNLLKLKCDYTTVEPLFMLASRQFNSKETKEIMKNIIRMLIDRFGYISVSYMKPYVIQFVKDWQSGKVPSN